MNNPSNDNPNREGKNMGKIDTQELFKKGREINENIEELMEQRAANRKHLRLLRDSEFLSDAEEQELDELYPPRERGSEEVGEDE